MAVLSYIAQIFFQLTLLFSVAPVLLNSCVVFKRHGCPEYRSSPQMPPAPRQTSFFSFIDQIFFQAVVIFFIASPSVGAPLPKSRGSSPVYTSSLSRSSDKNCSSFSSVDLPHCSFLLQIFHLLIILSFTVQIFFRIVINSPKSSSMFTFSDVFESPR